MTTDGRVCLKKHSRPNSDLRLLAASGVIAPALFTTLVIIASLLRPGYNHVAQYISDLGSGSDTTATIQRANFFLTGLLTIAFALGLRRSLSEGGGSKVGTALLALFGATAFGSGIFSCDAGCPVPGASFSQSAHNLLAITAFVAAPLAPWLVSKGMKSDGPWRRYRSYSVATSIVAFAVFIVFVFGALVLGVLSPWVGATQRLFLAVPWLWVEVTAIHLLRLSIRPTPALVPSQI